MKKNWIYLIEENLNKRTYAQSKKEAFYKVDYKKLEGALQNHPKGESLFHMLYGYLCRMKNPCFIKKSGKVDVEYLCRYACLNIDSWYYIYNTETDEERMERIGKQKKDHKNQKQKGTKRSTMLKLVIALKLNVYEAQKLMNKASYSLSDTDPLDRLVMAMLDAGCNDPNDAYEVMDFYEKNGAEPIKNIYRQRRNKQEEK